NAVNTSSGEASRQYCGTSCVCGSTNPAARRRRAASSASANRKRGGLGGRSTFVPCRSIALSMMRKSGLFRYLGGSFREHAIAIGGRAELGPAPNLVQKKHRPPQ